MSGFDVTSTVKFDMLALEKLTSSATKALTLTGAALLSEVKNAEVFPFETGNLQNESTFVDDSKATSGQVNLVTDTPYGRRLYYHPEYNYNREFNIAAGGDWYRPWLPGGQRDDFATETFAKIYKKENNL